LFWEISEVLLKELRLPKNELKDYFLSVKSFEKGTILEDTILGCIVGEICVGGGFCPIGKRRFC